eukprot:gene182-105_t
MALNGTSKGGADPAKQFQKLQKHLDNQDFSSAIQVCNTILQALPEQKEALQAKAYCNLELGRWHDALKVSEQNESLGYEKAIALYRLNKYQESLDAVGKAADQEAADYLRAQILHRMGRYDECVELYAKLFDKDPDDVQLFTNYLASLVCGNKASEALALIEEGNAPPEFDASYEAAATPEGKTKSLSCHKDALKIVLCAMTSKALCGYSRTTSTLKKNAGQPNRACMGLARPLSKSFRKFCKASKPSSSTLLFFVPFPLNMFLTNKVAFNQNCAEIDTYDLVLASYKLAEAKKLCIAELQEAGEEIGDADTEPKDNTGDNDDNTQVMHRELASIVVQVAYLLQRRGEFDLAHEVYLKAMKQPDADVTVLAVAANNVVAMRPQGKNLFDSMKRISIASKESLEHKLSTRQASSIAVNKCLLLLQAHKVEEAKKALVQLQQKF